MADKMKREGFQFPHDIVHNIFVRLPAKSLVRFKTVCKLWFTTICDSTFEEIHLQQQMSEIMIIKGESKTDISISCFEEEGLRSRKLVTVSFQGKHVVGLKSCKYLLLYHDVAANGNRLYVYDIITQRHKLLPSIPFYFKNVHSFVNDPSTEIYKVVIFRYYHELDTSIEKLICCIYSLDYERWSEDEDWRQFKAPVPQNVYLFSSCIIHKEMLYWISRRFDRSNRIFEVFIQPLEIATGTFLETIKLPPLAVCKYNLFKLKGSICLASPVSHTDFYIWHLKDSVRGLWIKEHTISVFNIVGRPRWFTSFYLKQFSPCLVLEGCNEKLTQILVKLFGKFYWYNIYSRQLKLIGIVSAVSRPTVSVTG